MSDSLLNPRLRLGDQLVARGFLSVEQLEDVLSEQNSGKANKLLGELLIDRGIVAEEQVLECLAIEYDVPFIRLDSRHLDPAAIELVPREFIEKHTLLPLFKIRDTLTVALTEPTNVFLFDRLRELTGCNIQIVLASGKDIRKVIQTNMPNTHVFVIDDIIDDASGDAVELIEDSIEEIAFDADFADQSPIIRLVNYIIYNAVKAGASDIHIEPTEKILRIRYRVDGALYQALEPPSHLAAAVASRVKIMADLDISERRLPQDGRIHVMMEGRPIDLRVSTLPLALGEKVVIRVLDNQNVNVSLEQLGFSADIHEQFAEQVQRPNGIALVTGPTGSGKSTTLYAALRTVTTVEKNVCTVEDPVEYQLPLVNQFQVNEKIGLTFAAVLRGLLRQDPDICMVGEIRDEETARIAVQAALTGHLVFSTLHTNDACSAITRLINMGVENYLLAASVNMVLAQRLCRRICPKCKMQYDPPKPMLLALDEHGIEVDEFVRGAGCKRCRHTGYVGRISIHELLIVDETLREIIATNPTMPRIKQHAKTAGMTSLRYDGLRKVKEGITTLEEVFRVT